MLNEQLTTFNGGCIPGCSNHQAAIHPAPHLTVLGDANGDEQFDHLDIVQVLQADQYRTGHPATFAEGDGNADRLFDQFDIVSALKTGRYVADVNAASRKVAVIDTILADDFGL